MIKLRFKNRNYQEMLRYSKKLPSLVDKLEEMLSISLSTMKLPKNSPEESPDLYGAESCVLHLDSPQG
jgi:hypothetical protein